MLLASFPCWINIKLGSVHGTTAIARAASTLWGAVRGVVLLNQLDERSQPGATIEYLQHWNADRRRRRRCFFVYVALSVLAEKEIAHLNLRQYLFGDKYGIS